MTTGDARTPNVWPPSEYLSPGHAAPSGGSTRSAARAGARPAARRVRSARANGTRIRCNPEKNYRTAFYTKDLRWRLVSRSNINRARDKRHDVAAFDDVRNSRAKP